MRMRGLRHASPPILSLRALNGLFRRIRPSVLAASPTRAAYSLPNFELVGLKRQYCTVKKCKSSHGPELQVLPEGPSEFTREPFRCRYLVPTQRSVSYTAWAAVSLSSQARKHSIHATGVQVANCFPGSREGKPAGSSRASTPCTRQRS